MISPVEIRQLCGQVWNEMAARDPIARLWRRDHTVWKPDPREIANRLGWLDLPTSMRGAVDDLNGFAAEVRSAGYKDVVLLGMGGSSLSAVVIDAAFPRTETSLNLHVLDSTIPAAILSVESRVDLPNTLFLVASKSGTTAEVSALYQYFSERMKAVKPEKYGENFVAITDDGTPLQKLAAANGFRRTFVNPSDLGGRYSVLSHFGLVPAALRGVEVGAFLARAREMARLCGVAMPLAENPGAWLGFVLGSLARNGRDKLTFITSPRLASFGLWAEQLVAESTGKEGRGIVPVAEEPYGPVSAYSQDRVFVRQSFADEENGCEERVRLCDEAGFPVLSSQLRDPYDLAAAFFKWEFAVALAGVFLQINPFDQPNVEESKQKSRAVLKNVEQGGRLPPLRDVGTFEHLLEWAGERDYVAFMAFVEQTAGLDKAFADLRQTLLSRRKLVTTLGYGPRFLHSTGQLHKGGADNGLFVQITADPEKDLPIPGASYTFGTLAASQALGDFEALQARRRRVIRIHVPKGESVVERIRELIGKV